MSIILDHINYCYSADSAYKVQALKDVSLEINDGEFIGIIGHTGSGKSTLIQHMNGLLKATSGHIYYNGQDIYDNDYDLSKLRHKVGMVFQYPEHQLFETTNFEDVCFGPKNQGLDRKTVELRAYEALQNVHFPEDLYYQPPFDLSGGQKRRVAIAGVLAMHPDVLILDEPTAGLDDDYVPDGTRYAGIGMVHYPQDVPFLTEDYRTTDQGRHPVQLAYHRSGSHLHPDHRTLGIR